MIIHGIQFVHTLNAPLTAVVDVRLLEITEQDRRVLSFYTRHSRAADNSIAEDRVILAVVCSAEPEVGSLRHALPVQL